MVKYADKLRDPRWQKCRLEIMNRDNFTCKYCGDTETELQVHHIKYTASKPWDEPNENLITVCRDCHRLLSGYKDAGMDDITGICKIRRNELTIIFYVKIASGLSICAVDGSSAAIISFTSIEVNKLKKFIE